MFKSFAKNLSVISALLLLFLGAVSGDALFRWGIDRAASAASVAPAETVAPQSAMRVPVALLGPAMAVGASHMLDRTARLSASLEPTAE